MLRLNLIQNAGIFCCMLLDQPSLSFIHWWSQMNFTRNKCTSLADCHIKSANLRSGENGCFTIKLEQKNFALVMA